MDKALKRSSKSILRLRMLHPTAIPTENKPTTIYKSHDSGKSNAASETESESNEHKNEHSANNDISVGETSNDVQNKN